MCKNNKITSIFSLILDVVTLFGITDTPRCTCHLMQICAGDFSYVLLMAHKICSSRILGASGVRKGLSFEPRGLYAVTKNQKIKLVIM